MRNSNKINFNVFKISLLVSKLAFSFVLNLVIQSTPVKQKHTKAYYYYYYSSIPHSHKYTDHKSFDDRSGKAAIKCSSMSLEIREKGIYWLLKHFVRVMPLPVTSLFLQTCQSCT